MNDFIALPDEISTAIDRIAKKQASKSDPDGHHYARLQVLIELGRELRAAEREVVDELRKNPKKNTWAIIADRTGASLGAVWTRYGASGTTTPESRSEQAARSQTRVAPADLEGVTVTQAQRLTGIYRPNIYTAIERNPDADWFVRATTNGKKGSVIRILDVDGLRRAVAGGVDGLTLTQAAHELGVERATVRECITRNPDAKWFTLVKTDGKKAATTLIVDIDALRQVITSR